MIPAKRKITGVMRFSLGLRGEIILNITFIMITAVFIIGVLMLKMAEKGVLQQKAKSGMTIVETVKYSLKKAHRVGLTLGDLVLREELLGLILALTKGEIQNHIAIVDRNAVVVAATRGKSIGDKLDDQYLQKALLKQEVSARINRKGGVLSLGWEGEMIINAPLYGQRGMLIGAVRLKMPLQDLTKSVIQSQKLIVLFLLIDSLVLVIFGIFLISRNILRPIQRMVQATEAISQGDFEARVSEESSNEIGKLARAFNRMSERLQDSRKQMEEQLRSLEEANLALQTAQQAIIRSERLASLGRLSAGVAHEIGNPIGAILGYIELLIRDVGTEEEKKDCLRRINEETQRIHRIIRGLLDFSRPSLHRKVAVDLNHLVEDSLALFLGQKGVKEVRVQTDLQEGLSQIEADPDRIKQVLVNLFINSLDAMDGSGVLTIRTEEASYNGETFLEGGPNLVFFPTPLKFEAGCPLLRIIVTDTGSGIKQEDLSNIFEPFFTTKEPGKGTGLGLAVSSSIIASYGGHLAVRSEAGRGTDVTILLPRGGDRGDKDGVKEDPYRR
jgi:signal transduction histidine kinase